MKRFSEAIFVTMLFCLFSVQLCPARTDTILSGQALLRVMRERKGQGTKPAYTKRGAKGAEDTELVVSNNQSHKSGELPNDKSLKTTLTDYTKDTKYPKTEPSLVHDVRGRKDITIARADTAVGKSSVKTTSLSDLASDTPLVEAIDIFRNSVEPPLNIIVLWRDLEENAGIDRATPINMDPVSGIELGTALKLLLESVSIDVKLGFIVENGVIIIATEQSLPRIFNTYVYDITYLLGQLARYRGQLSNGGSQRGNSGRQRPRR